MIEHRRPRFADLPGVYRVCFETAGLDEGANPDLVGHVYAGPYVARHPELASIVADGEGVAGYVLGCADTRAFEEWCEREWWAPLREQYPLGSGSVADAELVGLLHRPPRSPDDIVADHPAHLHIDLLPRLQGRGAGRVLIEWVLGALRSAGAPGVHLGVGPDNHNAIAFYRHLGFADAGGDANVLWMTRAL